MPSASSPSSAFQAPTAFLNTASITSSNTSSADPRVTRPSMIRLAQPNPAQHGKGEAGMRIALGQERIPASASMARAIPERIMPPPANHNSSSSGSAGSSLLPSSLLAALDSAGARVVVPKSSAPSPSGAFGPIGSRPCGGGSGSNTSSAPSTPGPGGLAAAGLGHAMQFPTPAAPVPLKSLHGAQPVPLWKQSHEPESGHPSMPGQFGGPKQEQHQQRPVSSLAAGMAGLNLNIWNSVGAQLSRAETGQGRDGSSAVGDTRGQHQQQRGPADFGFKGTTGSGACM